MNYDFSRVKTADIAKYNLTVNFLLCELSTLACRAFADSKTRDIAENLSGILLNAFPDLEASMRNKLVKIRDNE